MLTKAVAIIAAVVLTSLLLFGYVYFRHVQAERLQSAAAAERNASARPEPEVEVAQNEAMLRGSQAVIGGKVRNISKTPLAAVTVELSLFRRDNNVAETRSISTTPSELAPGDEGAYSVAVPREFSGARIARVTSRTANHDLVFRIIPGAARPPERPSGSVQVVARPSSTRGRDDEFINTPDKPVKLP